MQDGADQPLRLAQGEAEHGTERQGRGDRQAGVARLTAPGGPWLGCLGRDRGPSHDWGRSVLELNDVALAVIFGDCIAFKYRQAAASLRSGPKPESKNTQDILLVVFSA